jgi:hypothetical protein
MSAWLAMQGNEFGSLEGSTGKAVAKLASRRAVMETFMILSGGIQECRSRRFVARCPTGASRSQMLLYTRSDGLTNGLFARESAQ